MHAFGRKTKIEDVPRHPSGKWFVEAESEAEARAMLEQGEGHRSHIGERVQIELEKVSG